jgi:hypothetical protein
MMPTIAMRDFMAAYNFGGQSLAANKLIGRNYVTQERRLNARASLPPYFTRGRRPRLPRKGG